MPTHDPCCDKTFDPRLCIMRHNAGKQRVLRGMSESDKCATCPQIIEYLEEIKMTANKDSQTTKCVTCGREGLKIAARGMCKKCYYQAIKSGDKVRNRTETPADNPGEKPARPETKTPKTETKPVGVETGALKRPSASPVYTNDTMIVQFSSVMAKLTVQHLQEENAALNAMVDRLLAVVERQRKVMEASL